MLPEEKALDFSQIHLWMASLNVLSRHRDWVVERLDETERLRLSRAKLPEAAMLVASCRAFVREVLSRTQPHTQKRVIVFSQEGKPSLPGLFISWSRSEGQALLALTETCPIGVDLEHYSHFSDSSKFLPFFCQEERQKLQAFEDTSMSQACALLWLRKESVLKALGLGLAGSLAVSASPKANEAKVTFTACHGQEDWFCPVFCQKEGAFCVAQPKACGILKIVRHTFRWP